MPTLVTPEQRQAAKREIVWQVEQGATASVARSHSPVLMHRTTVYRVRVSRAERRRTSFDRWTAWAPLHFAWGSACLCG